MIRLRVALAAMTAAGLLWAGAAQAVSGTKSAKSAKSPKTPAKTTHKVGKTTSGTPLDSALAQLKLPTEKQAAIADAFVGLNEKLEQTRKQVELKRKSLSDQARKEKDFNKRTALQKQINELKMPSEVEVYESAKAAIKGIVTAEQLSEVDGLVKTAQLDMATKSFSSHLEGWSKKGVELNGEQKAKAQQTLTKMKEDVGNLPAGAMNQARSMLMTAVWSVRKDVLTDEQRARLEPTTRPDDGST